LSTFYGVDDLLAFTDAALLPDFGLSTFNSNLLGVAIKVFENLDFF